MPSSIYDSNCNLALELLGCNIKARLENSIETDLRLNNAPICYWIDSANAFYVIKRHKNWSLS